MEQPQIQHTGKFMSKGTDVYQSVEDDDASDGVYLCPQLAPFFLLPIGPLSECYFLYFWYTRIQKLYDNLLSQELADFILGYMVRFVSQGVSWLRSWQLIDFSISVVEDAILIVWSRAVENFFFSRMRKRHRIFDFFSNLTYMGIGMDLHGRWYKHDKETRMNRSKGVISMLWNKDDLNMSFVEYWIHKLTIQPLRPRGALWDRFSMFRIFYNKSYDPIEFFQRMMIFSQNLRLVRLLNDKEQGTAYYGVSQFSDLTVDEFAKKFGAYNSSADNVNAYLNREIDPVMDKIPTSFDWRNIHSVAFDPKDYRDCAAAWAYTVVDNIETLYAIKYGWPKKFSDQQVIDCDRKSKGCKGGSVSNAYQYIYKAGLTGRNNYTYRGYQEKCYYHPSMSVVEIQRGFLYVPPDEEKIRNFIYSYGPVTARVNIGPLQFYKKGIIRCNHEVCNPNVQNYVVNLIGYGTVTAQAMKRNNSDPMPYWTGKNYWSSEWGEKGFFRLYRGENQIGVSNFVTAPALT
ncbi:unnamed protein product [Bemisia tabaci]|uniref:Uncharacterized protein n=1 Tax=Bemisia tabaci TaxID=7038 RepID=A0A9P0AN09_BEMTA|nr:unnamed protein product [Bemisia tabaci]